MSLEQALAENTAAMVALTAALKGAGLSTGSGTANEDKPATSAKPKAKPAAEEPPASKHSRSEMNALLTQYKDKTDTESVRTLMGAKKMADVPDERIDEVFAAAKAALAKLAEADDEV